MQNQPAPVLFSQKIMYDRSKGSSGDLYAGKKPVLRCVMVVDTGREKNRYSMFITANSSFQGERFRMDYGQTYAAFENAFFSEDLAEILAVAREEAARYKAVS